MLKPNISKLKTLRQPIAKILVGYYNDMDQIPKLTNSIVKPIRKQFNQRKPDYLQIPDLHTPLSQLNVVPLSTYVALANIINRTVYDHYTKHLPLRKINEAKNDGWALSEDKIMRLDTKNRIVAALIGVINTRQNEFNDRDRLKLAIRLLTFARNTHPGELFTTTMLVMPDKDARMFWFAVDTHRKLVYIQKLQDFGQKQLDAAHNAMVELADMYPKLSKHYQNAIKTLFYYAVNSDDRPII